MKYSITFTTFTFFFSVWLNACTNIEELNLEKKLITSKQIRYFAIVSFVDKRIPLFQGLIPISSIKKHSHYYKLTSENGVIRKVEGFDSKGKNTRIIELDKRGLLISSVTFPFFLNGKLVKCEITKNTNFQQVCTDAELGRKRVIKGGRLNIKGVSTL